jgi:murein DD-endopeptidase MepM/ murein hydrolase activator NlpD
MVPGGVKPMREAILPYKVRDGETIDYIAQKFGVSVDTISIFNGPDEAPLKTVTAGQEIMILPVSGIRVRVQPNDTVTSISRRFNAPVENITGLPMNNVNKDTKLTPGDYLIVPEGNVPIFVAPKAATSSGSGSTSRGTVTETGRYVYVPPPPKASVTSSKAGSSAVGAISAPPAGAPRGTTGSMIWPMRGVITTYYGQTIWYGIHQGLDISTAANTPIVAADGGVVIQASWSNDGYGNMVMIAHSNGLYTLYGHLNQINVRAGQQVARGQVIGLEGSTGNSTGPHLHFEVRWGRIYGQTLNPLTYLR